MPTFEDPAADADQVQQALRGLAHATRSIDDPRAIYPVLGSLGSATASLVQSLHQLASFHDGPTHKSAWITGDTHAGRAASYRVSWDLHRAAEMLKRVADSIDHAHEVEATIAYDRRDFPLIPEPPRSATKRGLSL